jgi:hypothetical protein
MNVELTEPEIRMAATVGCERAIQSLTKRLGLTNHVGNKEWDRWGCDIEAAAAELAVAKQIGVFWGGDVNTFKKADIGRNWQVRHSRYPNGKLIVRPEDSNQDVFILVVGLIPQFTICGWIRGVEAKVDRFLEPAPPQAWFVPQSALHKKATTDSAEPWI